ncbi:MAG: Qc-SNARE SYP7-family [Trebouxia sp. A1-2]|nr:MAG: Qc-SNARE SYP7-family [Trebouxia sp. A1-2]
MSLADIVSRTEVIAKKYEKFTGDKPDRPEKSNDPFTDEYTDLVERINGLTLKADEIAAEKNRATKAALNAELRRSKAALLETDVPKLEKLIRKGKNVTKTVIDDRMAKVKQVRDGIAEIPDGVHGPRKPGRALTQICLMVQLGGTGRIPAGATATIELSGPDARVTNNPGYYQHSAESKALANDWQVAKKKQDLHLDNIEKGLSTLKGIGEAMGETLKTQDVLIDTIDTKMDNVTKELKTNNMKLKGLVESMRSKRNFCIDITLICVLLALGLYLYMMFKK